MPESSMFKIIGGNGIEYGPVSADQIRQWIAEGRASGQTLAQAEGTPGWKPLSAFPELASSLPVASPPLGGPLVSDEVARARAASLLAGPFVGLLVTAVMGFIGVAFFSIAVAMAHNGYDFNRTSPMNPTVLAVIKGKIGVVMCAIGVPGAAFILFGAIQTRRFKNYGVCIAAAIVAMVPYLSFCFYIGLPLGIWALVILCRADVRACFK